MASTKGIRSGEETEMVAVRSMISAWRLIDGGMAIFAPIIRNQSIVS